MIMPPARRRNTKASKLEVDEPVKNQENPGTSETERGSTERTQPAEVPSMAPAQEVDEVVQNQENPGLHEPVDRSEPQIVTDSAGISYDVSKSPAELVTSDPEDEKRKAELKQSTAALDGRTEKDDDKKYIEIEFLESGITAARRVWKAGEVLRVEDSDSGISAHRSATGNVWFEMSESEQREKYGKPMFKRK